VKVPEAVKTTLKFAFSFAVIAWLAKSGRFDLRQLKTLFTPGLIAGCTGFTFVNLALCNERWLMLLRSQANSTSRAMAAKLSMIGMFFNFVIPGGVGGDFIKGYYIARENHDARMHSVVSVAMDRLIGLFTMLIMALIAMLVDWDLVQSHKELVGLFLFLSSVFLAFCVFWAVIFSRRISSAPWLVGLLHKLPKGQELNKLLSSLSTYSLRKDLLFKALLFSFLAQATTIAGFIFVGHSLGFEVSANTYFFVVPVGLMVTAIPLAPGGIGVGQAAFYYLFELILVDKNLASTLGTSAISALQIYQLLFGLSGAWFYVTMKKRIPHAVA